MGDWQHTLYTVMNVIKLSNSSTLLCMLLWCEFMKCMMPKIQNVKHVLETLVNGTRS